MWGKRKITLFRKHDIKATCGSKLISPMVVAQRSKWWGQDHIWSQVPGFAPQQVKHLSPDTADKRECKMLTKANKNKVTFCVHFCVDYSSFLLLPAGSKMQMNAKDTHNLILTLWLNGKVHGTENVSDLWCQMSNIHFPVCFIVSPRWCSTCMGSSHVGSVLQPYIIFNADYLLYMLMALYSPTHTSLIPFQRNSSVNKSLLNQCWNCMFVLYLCKIFTRNSSAACGEAETEAAPPRDINV